MSDSFVSLHDDGYRYDKRRFRLFTFSEINGPHKIADSNIVFYDDVFWEVSSCDKEFIEQISEYFANNKINYNGQYYSNVECLMMNRKICTDEIIINMMSPIVAYQTDAVSRKKTYYSPLDDEFYTLVSDNFIRKYHAYTGNYPDGNVDISVLNVDSRDKCVTKFKDIYMTGYKGIYKLSGKIEYLDFLYQVGIGSANSQGFGMFEFIEE